MADYIFKVYLHTDRVDFNEDYSLSDYTFILPSFYYTVNEFVSARAEIDVTNSVFSCRGANTYNVSATIGGTSEMICGAFLSVLGSVTQASMLMNNKAYVVGNSIRYSDVTSTEWVDAYAIAPW